MIWADRVGIGLSVVAALLALFVVDDRSRLVDAFMWFELRLVLPVWIVLRVIDFVLTGSVRRR